MHKGLLPPRALAGVLLKMMIKKAQFTCPMGNDRDIYIRLLIFNYTGSISYLEPHNF